MYKKIALPLLVFIVALGIFSIGYFFPKNSSPTSLISPFVSSEPTPRPLPLLEYTINNLTLRKYQPSTHFTLERELNPGQNLDFKTYLFTFTTLEKKMSGAINIPATEPPTGGFPVIVMLRGWAPVESYYSGMGTKNAAAELAKNGFVTVAPDFFGYGESDPDFEDTWKGRFTKPINVIELIKTLESNRTLELPTNEPDATDLLGSEVKINPARLGIWAHSNGGQIALTTLEVLGQPIPTTLWAPVTAPFPYSVLFFSDENPDEGKEARAWVALFEKDYDVFEFSLTQHLDRLNGPLLLHHGTADEAALFSWSEEFLTKVDQENERRLSRKKELKSLTATASADVSQLEEEELLEPIKVNFYKYPGSNHNLQPGWDVVVERDIAFFKKWLY
ncbi:MAG: alpha/beta hydrolase family protein [Patescibacteria group bacterium]